MAVENCHRWMSVGTRILRHRPRTSPRVALSGTGTRLARRRVMGRSLIPVERIAHAILVCRGQKVLLDADLAALYGVDTKALNQAVRRNIARFPPDFMFQLNAREAAILKSQFVTSRS